MDTGEAPSVGTLALKRTIDIVVSGLGLLACWWLILLAFILASWDTRSFGLFIQTRIGKQGKPFPLLKIRTMRGETSGASSVTVKGDPRVTRFGGVLRRTKVDELPQLLNVFFGQMSLVGPRPDVPGFADRLGEGDRVILSVRPGVTGPATLWFRDEEELLANQPNPEKFNREVLFPKKVEMNRAYVQNLSVRTDLRIIMHTLVSLVGGGPQRRG